MAGAWINTTRAGKTNLLFGVIREGLEKVWENIIVVAVGGGYCQPTPWTGWNKSVSCLLTSGGSLGDASTNSNGDCGSLSQLLGKETMDEQVRTDQPGNTVMEKI